MQNGFQVASKVTGAKRKITAVILCKTSVKPVLTHKSLLRQIAERKKIGRQQTVCILTPSPFLFGGDFKNAAGEIYLNNKH